MEKLIFVYNANSGRMNALMGSLHKVVNPSTYSCKLCELTYGTFEEKKRWRDFRENLEVETEFLHKDEFRKTYSSKFKHNFEFPIVLIEGTRGLEVLISNQELKDIDQVEDLIARIKKRI